MDEGTTIGLVISGVLLPVIGVIVWIIRSIGNYFLKDGGFMDDIRTSMRDWFFAHKEYMQASREIQAATAARLDQHDGTVIRQTQAACDGLASISKVQDMHTEHFATLIEAGTKACDVALVVCDELALDRENAAAVEKIKRILEVKGE